MKKRERTINLVSEAEMLDTQNIELKSTVRTLELERRSLAEMLQVHGQSCVRQSNFQIPECTISVAKYLTDIGLATSKVISNEAPLIKTGRQSKTQKIPSMSTLKFNRRSQTQTRQSQLAHQLDTSSNSNSTPVSTPSSTSQPVVQPSQPSQPSLSQPQPQLSAADLGYCEGNDLNMVNDVILSQQQQQHAFAKALTSSDCYSIASPDSGFIKSPVDITNGSGPYANMATPNATTVLIKSDYIPNCDGHLIDGDALVMAMPVHCATPTPTNGGAVDMGFILKSELVDGNDSPYTNMHSADRFLFDGTQVFETDIEPQPTAHMPNHAPLMASPLHLQSAINKTHTMLLNNNNNNNIIGTHNQNGVCTMQANINGMHDFNSHCQPYIDYSLLKGDFLGQNGEFLTLAGDGSDPQFTELTSTDLDSGVTTYTSISNGNGCLA